jgi:RNA polymerase sigma-70 factor (ECF subfamily)
MVEMAWQLDAHAAERCYREADAARWSVARETFVRALERSARRAFGNDPPTPAQLDRHVRSLHLTDLALACACADGQDAAWEHFVREYRPVLYKAAAAIDASGGARDLADGLYAELFGLAERGGVRRSHLEYFHGRSSLATWLRAVLAQRYVDRVRAQKRVAPLPEDDSAAALPADTPAPPEHPRFVAMLRAALSRALARLAPRERLRLACYYAQSLTLAEIGRTLGEHEATVSRQLARTRKTIRQDLERELLDAGLDGPGVVECFAAVAADPGPLDLADLLEPADGKNPAPPRSAIREHRRG